MGLLRRHGEASHGLDRAIHRARASLWAEREELGAFTDLVGWVRARSPLLARCSPKEPDIVRALVAIARWWPAWGRPLEAWSSTHAGWVGLGSLAAHLFARFEVPAFLVRAWLTAERTPWQSLYVHLGSGGSVRTAGLPVRLTREAAHLLLQSPRHLDPIAAARRAQVLALGGGEELARTVASTRMGHDDDPAFEDAWDELLRFFVRFPEITPAEVGPIVDFVHARRLAPRDGVDASGRRVALGPPEPDLSLRGRTPASVRRLVASFHRELARASGRAFAWAPSGLRGASFVEDVTRGDPPRTERHLWTVRELCSSAELAAEGRALRHCVATYGVGCASGRTSIWSLRVEGPYAWRRALTIEVDVPRRAVRQARGACNALPRPREMELLARWAAEASLTIPEGFRG